MRFKKEINQIVIGAAALSMTLGQGMTVYAASGTWVKDNASWKYQEQSGSYASGKWVHDGIGWFYLNANGSMKTGWHTGANGLRYYLYPATGGSEGKMLTGWYQVDGSWYFAEKSNGNVRTGWFNDGGTWYFLDSSGVMQTGVVSVGGKVYYLNPNADGTKGSMKTGAVVINGVTYNFDASGAATGTTPTVGKKFNSNGTVVASSSGGSSSNKTTTTTQAEEAYIEAKNKIANVVNSIDEISAINLVRTTTGTTTAITVNVEVVDKDDAMANVITDVTKSAILGSIEGAASIKYSGSISTAKIFDTIAEAQAAFDIWEAANSDKPLGSLGGYSITATFPDGTTVVYTIAI